MREQLKASGRGETDSENEALKKFYIDKKFMSEEEWGNLEDDVYELLCSQNIKSLVEEGKLKKEMCEVGVLEKFAQTIV